jgi:hypothetical protein
MILIQKLKQTEIGNYYFFAALEHSKVSAIKIKWSLLIFLIKKLTWKKLSIFVGNDVLAEIGVGLAANDANVVLHGQVVLA